MAGVSGRRTLYRGDLRTLLRRRLVACILLPTVSLLGGFPKRTKRFAVRGIACGSVNRSDCTRLAEMILGSLRSLDARPDCSQSILTLGGIDRRQCRSLIRMLAESLDALVLLVGELLCCCCSVACYESFVRV